MAIAVHEFAHAYAANKLGDPTPRLQGRLTLNPIAHLDPVGTLLIVLVGIGWGRPVEFNPGYLKNPRRDAAIVAFAGPLSNIIIALITLSVLAIIQSSSALVALSPVFIYFITLNIALAVFNMIPVEPLDGFKIVGGLLTPHLAYQWEDLRKYGIFLLLILFLTGAIDRTIFPLVNYIVNLLLTLVVNP
jgi:Zn-dependent protease